MDKNTKSVYPVSEAEAVNNRSARLADWMRKQKIDAAIITRPENVYYLSCFNPVIFSKPAFFLLSAEGAGCLLVHSLRLNHARDESVSAKIRAYGVWGDVPIADNDPVEAAGKILGLGNAKIRLGLEMGDLSVSMYRDIMEKLPIGEVADLTPQLEEQKKIKDCYEIEHIRKAASLADICALTMKQELSQGATEAQACIQGQYAMKKRWQESFPQEEISGFAEGGMLDALMCWCLSGERIAYACDCPKPFLPKTGELIVSYIWGKVSGYHAEVERTLYIGTLDVEKENAIQTVMDSRKAMFSVLKPGISFGELYEAGARSYYKHGLERMLPGRFGHGIGLSAHEALGIGKGSREVLKENMVFTVEPGLTTLKWGGARISETVLVTSSGYEILTKANSDIVSIR